MTYCHKIPEADLVAALERAGGNCSAAARELGVDKAGLIRRVQRLRKLGIVPDMAGPTFTPKAFSTLKDGDGNVKLVWEKTERDNSESALKAVRDGFIDQIPRAVAMTAPDRAANDLLNCYVITDYHLGMLSWGEETGDDWDVTIAENLILRWFTTAIRQAPKADKAVFAQLGDFMHWDGMDAVTPASKHLLDADTRFQKLVRVCIRVMRAIIHQLLKKYPEVHIICAEGNHDPASSIWLREWLSAFYDDEPRVSVDVSPDPYYCVEHGETSLFFHHGHKRKPTNIDAVFTAKFREVFGRTKHSYAHMGHMHHRHQLETNLMVVEQHRTLAASDAYASRGGWISGRDAQVITYHAEHGEVGRIVVNSRMCQ
jgi:transposase-like protein